MSSGPEKTLTAEGAEGAEERARTGLSHRGTAMLTLGIETSCDETSAAVVEGERRILSNIVASQFDLHARYGGVVPELACRRHVEVISQTVETALDEAGVAMRDIGLVSVVKG
ncbi:unnamed protein product, partial [marine sediment metagenome]